MGSTSATEADTARYDIVVHAIEGKETRVGVIVQMGDQATIRLLDSDRQGVHETTAPETASWERQWLKVARLGGWSRKSEFDTIDGCDLDGVAGETLDSVAGRLFEMLVRE